MATRTDLVSLSNQSDQLFLSTANLSQKDSVLSNVSFPLPNGIGSANNDTTTILSLDSFTFTNSFFNVVAGANTLKIITTYNNSGAGQLIITVTVTPGCYSIDSLLSYINANCNLSNPSAPYASNVSVTGTSPPTGNYGLGTYGSTAYPLGFVLATSCDSFITLTMPNSGPSGLTGVYLLVDATTVGLMDQLGITTYVGGSSNTTPVYNGAIAGQIGVGYAATSGITAWTTRDYYNLNGPTELLVSISGVNTGGRASCNGLYKSSAICKVPVNQARTFRNVYTPPNPFPCCVGNFANINVINILITNANDNTPINFNGMDWSMTLRIDIHPLDSAPKNAPIMMNSQQNNPIGATATNPVPAAQQHAPPLIPSGSLLPGYPAHIKHLGRFV